MATEPVNAWALYDAWEDLSNGRHGMEQATRDAVREGAQRSASIILPMIFETLGTPEALLDVGAGEGWWTLEAKRLGVPSAVGMDAMHSDLVHYWNAEGSEPLMLRGLVRSTRQEGSELHIETGGLERWPLALCLEVAEHVTPAAGDHLVAELCRVADEIVWSAAIPGQGGDGHINEQWPAYWSKRFNHHGFQFDDPWRLDLWHAEGVEPWYAQNLLLAYRHGHSLGITEPPLALVHPTTWSHHRGVAAPRP